MPKTSLLPVEMASLFLTHFRIDYFTDGVTLTHLPSGKQVSMGYQKGTLKEARKHYLIRAMHQMMRELK